MRPETAHEWPNGAALIIDADGKPHLPIRKTEHGPNDHALMGDAHAALFAPGGHRGQRYAGPRVHEAIAKLKTAYQQEGMEWPD
jgi:hypothetical protein